MGGFPQERGGRGEGHFLLFEAKIPTESSLTNSTQSEVQKPVQVIFWWNSLAFSRQLLPALIFTGAAPQRASTSSGKKISLLGVFLDFSFLNWDSACK